MNLVKIDFEEIKRERILDIARMQNKHKVVIDPFYVFITTDDEKFIEEVVALGSNDPEKDCPQVVEELHARHNEAYQNFLNSVERHYPFGFIMELHALYKKYGATLNVTRYEAAVEPGQDTSG